MEWLRKKCPRAGQKAKKVSGLKEPTTKSLRVTVSNEKITQLKVAEDFESRPGME